jgi:hypothetical protein
MIGPLVFKVCTPFPLDVASVAAESAYAPVVCGYLEYDNTHSTDSAELVFGVGRFANVFTTPSSLGIEVSENVGFATLPSAEAKLVREDQLFDGTSEAATALLFSVPAHEKRIFPLVVGFYQSGYFYTESHDSLNAVLDFGLQQHATYVETSDRLDGEFMRSALGFVEKQKLTDELRAWLANSRRLLNDPPVDVAPVCQIWRRLGGRP